MNLFVIFLTGLTTGGLSCLAMQGGLLASVIANQKGAEQRTTQKDLEEKTGTFAWFNQLDWLPVLMFLATKLIAHTLLGALLGLLGSAVTLSVETRLVFQVLTVFFLLATAMNLLDVHPVFRYIAFEPPKFLQRMVRNTSKSKALFAPAVLGFMTIFVPCGVTQAMEVLAVNSGSALYGALIMFSFVLGTSPLFVLLGFATAKLSAGWFKRFTKIAAYSLVAMALYSLNGVLVVANSPVSLQNISESINLFFSQNRSQDMQSSSMNNEQQRVKISVLNNGYSPKKITVKSGQPVELTLQSNETYSCALSFIFKEFSIKAVLEPTDKKSFSFTPTKKGKYTFSCSMGMYSGIMEVI